MRKTAPLLVMMLVGCSGVPFKMETPPGFVRYEESKDFRFITADGVRLQGRRVENKPVANLAFWQDALKEHLEKRGYTFQTADCFQTKLGLDGCTLEFAVPSGAEDWTQSETIFVQGDDVLLIEAAGPYERYAPRRAGITQALRSFDPNR